MTHRIRRNHCFVLEEEGGGASPFHITLARARAPLSHFFQKLRVLRVCSVSRGGRGNGKGHTKSAVVRHTRSKQGRIRSSTRKTRSLSLFWSGLVSRSSGHPHKQRASKQARETFVLSLFQKKGGKPKSVVLLCFSLFVCLPRLFPPFCWQ